ncbi:MAG: hypothetical protein M3O02_11290 [Acidobacteriota bacterium]|nr:hypothetical protein [Acidobacteriota bacterium]
MVEAHVSSQSVAEVDAYLEGMRQRVFAGVRTGMQEAMEGLAYTVVDKLQGNPIVSRSGRLLGAILGGIKVRENAAAIKGTVSTDTHDGRNLGQWLEDGHDEPAVVGKLHFFAADGVERWIHGHRAFHVDGKPFLNPSLQEYEPTIMAIINQKVADAVVD